MNQEQQVKTTITAIKSKLDKNQQTYFQLTLTNHANYFYVFSFNLKTWSTLEEAPYNFINRSVLIAYQELPNQNNHGTFYKVQAITII